MHGAVKISRRLIVIAHPGVKVTGIFVQYNSTKILISKRES
jgi:hypothetical protein